jgi:hypothetical protein
MPVFSACLAGVDYAAGAIRLFYLFFADRSYFFVEFLPRSVYNKEN